MKLLPHDVVIEFNVFRRTACTVAIVYSSASAILDLVAEWAKNKAANKSPTPVNMTSVPITGTEMVCLTFVLPIENKNDTDYKRIRTKDACITLSIATS